MSSTPQGHAGEQGGPGAGEGQAAKAPARDDAQDTQAIILEKLEKLESDRDRLAKENLNIRRAFNNRDLEIQSLREQVMSARRAATVDDDQREYPPDHPDKVAADFRAFQQRQHMTEAQLAELRFQSNHRGWEQTWDKVQELLNDTMRAPEVASYRPDGSLDYYKTLRNAHRDILLEDVERSREEADRAREREEAKKRQLARDASISGSSAGQLPEGISWDDIQKMSAEEMVRRGLVKR